MRRLALLLVSVGLAASAGAQVIGVQPEPMGLYWWDSTQAQFDKQVNAYAAYPQQNTPRPIAFYGWNSALGMWTPCDIVTQSCPWAGGTVTSFTSGNLPPLFNTSVANPTTTPVQTFTAINQGAQSAFGNWSGATAPPFFATIVCAGVLSCGYNSGSNSFTLSASSYQTIIQVDGTPTTPASPVTLNSTTPAADLGYQNVRFKQDGSANVSGEIPNAPSQFTMQTIPPTTGQYAIVDFTVVSAPGDGVACHAPRSRSGRHDYLRSGACLR